MGNEQEELVFKHKWLSGGSEHQKIILTKLCISKPENTEVKKMIIADTGIITIIESAEGKYWGLAFAQLLVEHFGLPSTEWAVTEKMENLSLHCFAGLPPHHGFVSAFKVGSTVKLTLR